MKNFLRLLALTPYGDNLSEPQTSVWLIKARAYVLIVGGADAFAWSYLGYTMATGNARWYAAAAVGLLVFVAVGSLDASFIMLDTWQEKEPELRNLSPMQRMRRWLNQGNLKTRLAIITRVLLLCGSFYITAPFLAQLVFWRDVNAELARQNATTISTTRSNLATRLDADLTSLQTKRGETARRLEQEIAGRGGAAASVRARPHVH